MAETMAKLEETTRRYHVAVDELNALLRLRERGLSTSEIGRRAPIPGQKGWELQVGYTGVGPRFIVTTPRWSGLLLRAPLYLRVAACAALRSVCDENNPQTSDVCGLGPPAGESAKPGQEMSDLRAGEDDDPQTGDVCGSLRGNPPRESTDG
jgi:hypothetical protein